MSVEEKLDAIFNIVNEIPELPSNYEDEEALIRDEALTEIYKIMST